MGFVFRLIPPRPDFMLTMSAEERAMMTDHAAYWSDLLRAGTVVAFGPVADDVEPYGVGIVVAADLAEAEAIRDQDPAVTSERGLRTEITPMVRLVTATGVHDAG
jgi:uncharacterized protein YciI